MIEFAKVEDRLDEFLQIVERYDIPMKLITSPDWNDYILIPEGYMRYFVGWGIEGDI